VKCVLFKIGLPSGETFFSPDYFSSTRVWGSKSVGECQDISYRRRKFGNAACVSRGSSCSATAPTTKTESWRQRHSNPHHRSFPDLRTHRGTLFPYSQRNHKQQQQTCQTNPTTTSPAPHHHHHPRTISTPSLPPRPAQPPSHPRTKNGNLTPKENGKSHCSSWSCFSQWC
jgi:hypothetical protein